MIARCVFAAIAVCGACVAGAAQGRARNRPARHRHAPAAADVSGHKSRNVASRTGSSNALTIYPQPNTAGGKGAPIAVQSLEFDFNDNVADDPGYDYNFSSPCLLQAFDSAKHINGPRWQIWGEKTDPFSGQRIMGWIDSGMACTPQTAFSKQTWHHLTWRYRVDLAARQTHDVSLTIDGITTAPNPLPNPITKLARVQARSDVQVQFQQDVRNVASPPPSFTEWVDDVTLTLW